MKPQNVSGTAQVVTYPAPPGEATDSDYAVTVNGQPVAVYRAQTMHHEKQYFFASFDFCGDVEVEVTSSLSLAAVTILPESCGIVPCVTAAGTLRFAASKPFRISIERDGMNRPLLLFGNPLEAAAPTPGDPGVVYFGPGVHQAGKIVLSSNQTLYLAGGAVVKGGVEAHGENITLCGRGIIDGSDYPHGSGPTPFMLIFEGCRNVLIKDVIVRGSWLFTIAPCGCEHVVIDNVKLCGSRVGNDDGIDIINSSDVTVNDCFLLTDDDCIAIKGLGGRDRKNCENIRITNCAFWTDRANIFRIGYESDAGAMRDISARNIDVLHCVNDDRPPDTFWSNWVFYLQPSNAMPMSDVHFENIRVNAPGQNSLIKILPMVCKGFGAFENGRFVDWEYTEPGRCVSNCCFKDIRLTGNASGHPGRIYVSGVDAEHPVENVTFENVLRFGERVSGDSPDVLIGPHTSNITFR
jgi:hypothetical protein